jgi:hypothetical protein
VRGALRLPALVFEGNVQQEEADLTAPIKRELTACVESSVHCSSRSKEVPIASGIGRSAVDQSLLASAATFSKHALTQSALRNAVSVLWLCLCACASSPAADTTSLDWQFPDNANPALPTVASNAPGAATAAISVGFGSAGWLADLEGFGTQTGIWDLGFQDPDDSQHDTRGRILLSFPSAPGARNGAMDLGLRIVQFVDNSIYKGDLTFSVPPARIDPRVVVEQVPGPLGGAWVEDTFHWLLAQVSLTITGAVGGTVLDRIRVDMVIEVAETSKPVITSVEKRGLVLVLSWAGGRPPFQLYAKSTLLFNSEWQAVGLPTSGTNAEILLDVPAKFVRVADSN